MENVELHSDRNHSCLQRFSIGIDSFGVSLSPLPPKSKHQHFRWFFGLGIPRNDQFRHCDHFGPSRIPQSGAIRCAFSQAWGLGCEGRSFLGGFSRPDQQARPQWAPEALGTPYGAAKTPQSREPRTKGLKNKPGFELLLHEGKSPHLWHLGYLKLTELTNTPTFWL